MSIDPTTDDPTRAAANPYAPPHTDPAKPQLHQPSQRWFRPACIAQLLVLLSGLGLELFDVESIMGTGPIYLAAGILTAVAAYRRSDLHGIYVGCSAIALAIGLFGLIFVNGWGPAEADLPVSIILWVYAVIVIPMLVYLIMARDKTPLSSSPLLKNSEKPV